jgi:hypothetical protein
MTTSRISEKSSPTQPSVPATTGKQRICHLSKSFASYCHGVIYEASVYMHCLKKEGTKMLFFEK